MEIQHCKHCGGPIGNDQSFLLAPGHYVHADVRRCVLHLSARIEAGSSGATDLFCEKDQAIAALSARVAELEGKAAAATPDLICPDCHSRVVEIVGGAHRYACIDCEWQGQFAKLVSKASHSPDAGKMVSESADEEREKRLSELASRIHYACGYKNYGEIGITHENANDMLAILSDYRRLHDSRLVLTDAERAILREAIEFSDSCGHKDRSFILRRILAAAQ